MAGDIQVVMQDLDGFSTGMQKLVARMRDDNSAGKFGQWKTTVSATTGSGSAVMDFGQSLDDFQSAIKLAADYRAALNTFFNTDLVKLADALTVLGEAASKISANYKGASDVDTQNVNSVDDALNSAPVPSSVLGG